MSFNQQVRQRIARTLGEFAARLMTQPTAPYHEHAVRAEVEKICDEHGLAYHRDSFGNLLIKLRTASRRRPLVLAAHLDHPGFEILGRLPTDKWLARFRGGVPDQYFRKGIRLRLMPGAIPAKLGRRRKSKGKQRIFEVNPLKPVGTVPQFALWDLVDFARQEDRIRGRACDDLIGSATVLATLVELKRSRAKVDVIGVLSRAEEVGFHGALALAAGKGIPKNSLVISLETSKELPGVKIGQGVIIRVGDRTSVFSSEGSRFLIELASSLGRPTRPFPFQRALMSGGTCEATAYQEFGFESAAVCVALGNYHNCAAGGRIAAEHVSVGDVNGMVQLLLAAALRMPMYEKMIQVLAQRLNQLRLEAEPVLRRTAG